MKLIHVGAAVLNQTPLDWDGNGDRIRRAMDLARADGATVLCLPELCITGYGCEDAFHSPDVYRMAWTVLHELLPDTHGLVVVLGLPVFFRGALFNAGALVVDGRLVGLTPKQHLAGDGLHYEPRWFKPWPAGHADTIDDGTPIGDLHYDVGGVRIGFEICEDAWVAERPGSGLSGAGVDLILNPSASHFAFGKQAVRTRFVLEGSRAFGVTYVYANLLGNEAGRAVYDGGAMIAEGGRLVAAGPRFSFAEVGLTSAVVDIETTRMVRARTGSFQPDLGEDEACVTVSFDWPVREPRPSPLSPAAWESSDRLKEEEFSRAVALALFDYARKSRSRGFIVSLSGGADSAAVAALVAVSVRESVRELGLPEALRRWGLPPDLLEGAAGGDARILTQRVLTTVYQPTRNSSQTSRNAATAVAHGLGAEHLEMDVDALVEGYRARVEKAIGRSLDWDRDDIALQNIQARARAPGVWMLANIKGALLLSTSNRSEAAVGYATMDGDTCGGVSPVAGIDKVFLLRWLRWMEEFGPDGLGPFPSLAAVNVREPTAELRPAAAEQRDEDDLMPYDILDAVERAAIRDRHGPIAVYRVMRAARPDVEPRLLASWIDRFFRLWSRNQWKRERYAPSFHVDDENLDPKTWCRFPILSGGFERELRELRDRVSTETTP
jgi:NAD+ synthase (glutamine-hydrolysing)